MLSVASSSLTLPKVPVSSPSPVPRPGRTRFRFRPLVTASATAYKQRPNLYVKSADEMATCTASLYQVLGIPIGATTQEIKLAYRKLARSCHPDVAAMDRKDSSADEFIKLHTAYSTLSDPEKRAIYDRKLFRSSRPLTAGISGYSGRNWETDQCW